LKIIEKIGTGIKRIKEYYKNYSVKPTLEVFENSVKITLSKVNKENVSEDMNRSESIELNNRELEVVELLNSRGNLERREIEQYLDLKRSQTGDILKSLREKKLVMKIGSGSNVKYKIISNR
jgi:ATP-dependent DNA helicase RecG